MMMAIVAPASAQKTGSNQSTQKTSPSEKMVELGDGWRIVPPLGFAKASDLIWRRQYTKWIVVFKKRRRAEGLETE